MEPHNIENGDKKRDSTGREFFSKNEKIKFFINKLFEEKNSKRAPLALSFGPVGPIFLPPPPTPNLMGEQDH